MDSYIKIMSILQSMGFTVKTNMAYEFSAAVSKGPSAVKEVYDKAMAYEEADYLYYAELILILNWMGWILDEDKPEIANEFFVLYLKAKEYAFYTLGKDDAGKLFMIID